MISKKGSLNLSIQAIVILVMAMALLALGLGFIRTLFDTGGTKLIGEIDNINIMQATDSDPIQATNTVMVKIGKYEQLQVSVYNKDVTGTNPVYTVTPGSCVGSAGITISCPATITVPLGEARGFGCAVKTTSGSTVEGLYSCQLTVAPTTGNQLVGNFFVEATV